MRAERLRRTRDIEIVREEGALTVDPHFTIRSKPNALGVIRVAVASPRALGTAVRRNRARRRVREAIRTLVGARRAAPGGAPAPPPPTGPGGDPHARRRTSGRAGNGLARRRARPRAAGGPG